MIRTIIRQGRGLGAGPARPLGAAAALAAAMALFAAAPVGAQTQTQSQKQPSAKPASSKSSSAKPSSGATKTDAKSGKADAKAAAKPDAKAPAAGKPALLATYGDWGVYTASAGKSKTCYALGQPKDRQPASLKRDPAYLFVSSRPGEGVRNEVSIVMGFEVKPDGNLRAEIGPQSFQMVAKGANLWVRNAAEEGQMLELMKKSGRLVVKAQSLRGNASTDSYSLSGLAEAAARAAKECQ